MRSIDAVVVYRRAGCPSCMLLRRGLRRRGIPVRERDIWADRTAAALVRAATGGTETVPTVVIGRQVLVNPTANQVLAALHAEAPHLVPARPAGRGWRRRRSARCTTERP